jgi:hypothetical protein
MISPYTTLSGTLQSSGSCIGPFAHHAVLAKSFVTWDYVPLSLNLYTNTPKALTNFSPGLERSDNLGERLK